jgi:kynurenine 3-monooxygenase
VSLDTATLHIGETERGAWEDKSMIWFWCRWCFFQNSSPIRNAKACLIIPRILTIGYKELNIPANADGTHKLDKNFHIWPRGEYMLIALANLDGSFTCTCLCHL